MSKSKLKPEDIFFGLTKTIEADNTPDPRPAEPAKKAEPAPVVEEAPKAKTTRAKAAKAETAPAEKKTRGRKADPEKAKRIQMNVWIAPETKYAIMQIVNEMKMQGASGSYSMSEFVTEAVEEKIKRSKKQLGLD